MSSPAYDLASYIATTLAQGTLGTDVFVNIMPDTPNDAVAVYQYGGGLSGLGMGSANADALEEVSIQVAVRDSNPSDAESKIYTIYKALDGLRGVTISSVSYLFMRAMQPPFVLGRDEQERATYVFNLEIQRRRA